MFIITCISKTVTRNTPNKYQDCIQVDSFDGTKCKAVYHKDQVNDKSMKQPIICIK